MQYSHTQSVKKAIPQSLIARGLKITILLVVGTYVYWQLRHEENLREKFWVHLHALWTGNSMIALTVPLLLMPVNWAIEAMKWKMLAQKVEKITFTQAFSGVLTGLSLGFITPRSIGGYAGRVWQLKQSGREKAVGAIMLGRLAQFFCTLLFGCFGIGVLFRDQFYPMEGMKWGILMALLFSMLSVLLMFLLNGRKCFTGILLKLFGSGAESYFKVLNRYTKKEIVAVIGLSAVRYIVFSLQFLWVLALFHFKVPVFVLLAGVTWIFVAKSVIPAFNFLSDLGIREFSALYFFSVYPVAQTKVITASLIIWLLNILLPTLLGTCFIIKMKIFRN